MAAAYKVLKNTARAGNAIIGAGVYSAVLQQGEAHECKVIKIANTTFDPWLDYYNNIISSHLKNAHVPQVTKVYVDEENNYYVANMEELDKECWDLYEDWDFDKYDFAVDISNLIIGKMIQSEFVETYEEFQDILFPSGIEEFFQLCDAITDETDVMTSDDEYENCLDPRLVRKLDIHASNIMFRRGAVVITDPWCNLDVDDHPSMDGYIEDVTDKHIIKNYQIDC